LALGAPNGSNRMRQCQQQHRTRTTTFISVHTAASMLSSNLLAASLFDLMSASHSFQIDRCLSHSLRHFGRRWVKDT
jgi:hypothetical protein